MSLIQTGDVVVDLALLAAKHAYRMAQKCPLVTDFSTSHTKMCQ